jgi:glycosyltransferase involved in cell wall biosynthesis
MTITVVLVIDSIDGGGAERSLALTASGLARQGVTPVVYCLWDRGGPAAENLRGHGVEVAYLPEGNLLVKLRGLRERLRKSRPDVLHTSLLQADIIGRLAAIGMGIPLLSSAVSTAYADAAWPPGPSGHLKKHVVKSIDRATIAISRSSIHAVTAGVSDHVIHHLRVPSGRVHVIHRGRDLGHHGGRTTQRRQRARVDLGLGNDTPVVLGVGRQAKQKGFRLLLEAAPSILKAHPETVFLIAGAEGNVTRDLRAVIDSFGLSTNVRLLGQRADIHDLMCGADVLAVPSTYEGTSGVTIEAWGLQLPVVISDLEGMKGLTVDEVNCLVVARPSADEWARAVGRCLSDRVLAGEISANGRRLFEREFSLEENTGRIAELYKILATRGRS